jgi:hypothetical protein
MKKIMFNDRYGLTKAVLEGRKTMTRRIIKPQPIEFLCVEKSPDRYMEIIQKDDLALRIKSHYKVGEVVAVAQSYENIGMDGSAQLFEKDMSGYYTRTDLCKGWRNKMFVRSDLMPHQIRITGIRCERLQDISYEECLREGVGVSATDNLVGFPIAIPFNYYIGRDEKGYRYVTPREAFSVLIDKISGRGTWNSNPYVWVYEFELIK